MSSVTSTSTDLFPVANLIQGPGVGFDSISGNQLTNPSFGGSRWVTNAPGGFPSDYIAVAGAPIITLDLGQDVPLNEISVWGYTPGNANGVSEFDLQFATNAEGTGGFGTSITYNPTFNPTIDDVARQSFGFGQVVTARYVEFTATDTFFSTGGFGPPAGGDRAGLGEIAFQVPIIANNSVISNNGATVTVNEDGSFTYDPTTALNSLGTGESLTDTFVYTVGDTAAPALPTPVAPLALWLDANDIDGDGNPDRLSDGTDVNFWSDKSANDRDLELGGRANNDPSYVLNTTANGMPAVAFDGNDQLIGDYNFDNLGDNYTIITVARYSGTQGANGDYERLITSDSKNWLYGYWGQRTEAWYANGFISASYNAAASTGDNNWHMHSGVIGPAVSGTTADPGADFWKDGVQLADNNTGSSGDYKPGRLSLGAFTHSDQESSVGQVAEILIYDGALSDAERLAVEAYLDAKYTGGDHAVASVLVSGVNDAPIANDDSNINYATTPGGTVVTDTSTNHSLLHLDALSDGEYSFTADGQTFDATVENVNGTGWLLVGRGREGCSLTPMVPAVQSTP